ncbi:hypothetical protein [Salinactinospora qingdaonensis]|uniref:hypothetical protein n=1 Tax=Salinactinospora qingdaonensis TaxID=702744 RepID=UPI0031E9C697
MGRPSAADRGEELPLGVEAFAAIALYVTVSGIVAGGARVFAWCFAAGVLIVGAFGQASYHLSTAERQPHAAPIPVMVFVSVLPVVVVGLSSVLLHLAERQYRAGYRQPAGERAGAARCPPHRRCRRAPRGTGYPHGRLKTTPTWSVSV